MISSNQHTNPKKGYLMRIVLLSSVTAYLDLLGSCGFLSLGEGCGKELGLDSWLKLGGCCVSHLLLLLLLLLLLSWLSCLHCHLLGADLRGTSQSYSQCALHLHKR